jgi:hypothetical protein
MSPQAFKLTRLNAVTATDQGATAARADEPITACPYDGTLNDSQDFMQHHWLKGYRRALEGDPT